MRKSYVCIFASILSMQLYTNDLSVALELSSMVQTIAQRTSENEQSNPFQDLFSEESVQREHLFEENTYDFNNLTYQAEDLLFHAIKEIKALILHAFDIQSKNDRKVIIS